LSDQPFIFDPIRSFAQNVYNEEANNIESGFGLGMVIWDSPGFVGGGQQLNVDLSQRTISPDVVLEAAKNPNWILVALVAIILLIIWARSD